MMIVAVANAAIDAAVRELEDRGLTVTRCDEGGYAILILEAYPLPPGWSKTETQLLLKLPLSFPNGKPDMFWTGEDLTLADGGEPEKAGVVETMCGKGWRRFSWHPQTWTPGKDDIHTFREFVDRRLAQRK
jgi:hypothetical protein